MKSLVGRWALILFAAAGNASAAAEASFLNPDSMSDIPRAVSEREAMQEAFRQHLSALSARLPQSQILKVEFLDIDLAGDVFPRIAMHGVRILGGAGDRPMIHLRYTIEQDGKTVGGGERRLVNSGYLSMGNRYDRDTWGHEKQMLDDWFRKDVIARR